MVNCKKCGTPGKFNLCKDCLQEIKLRLMRSAERESVIKSELDREEKSFLYGK